MEIIGARAFPPVGLLWLRVDLRIGTGGLILDESIISVKMRVRMRHERGLEIAVKLHYSGGYYALSAGQTSTRPEV